MAGPQGPMARADGLLIESIGDELLVFDEHRQVAHSLNQTAARVWQACDGRRDLGSLIVECGVDEPTLRLALERLQSAQLLANASSTSASAGAERVSRRAVLMRGVLGGAGVGVAIPVIRSIVAPSAALAATCAGPPRGFGAPCNSTCQCSAGSCCCGGIEASPVCVGSVVCRAVNATCLH